MSILANLTVLSSGMGLGYSAITLHSLTREDDPLRLNTEQASWFGKLINLHNIEKYVIYGEKKSNFKLLLTSIP